MFIMKSENRFRRSVSGFRSALSFASFWARNSGNYIPAEFGISPDAQEKDINHLLVGYPHNHKYALHKKKMLPSFQLYERHKLVASALPEKLVSFLDIGCCKGYYALNAALHPHCRVSAGIDIHEPFVSVSQKVREYLGLKNAFFYLSDLEKVSGDPKAHGGPFQTILLIGTYQYLFWGSGIDSNAYYSHRDILARLAGICTDRLILSARLETGTLPSGIREKARILRNKVPYTTENFLQAAREFFRISIAGYMGKYPLFVLSKS
jgi:hypothetical protein